MINSVVVMGNLTRDGELKYSPSGTPILKFAIAVNRKKKVGEKWVDEANFFDCTMIGKFAEAISKKFSKGGSIVVQGELHQNRWEQDGQPKSKIEIFATQVQLVDKQSTERKPQRESQQDFGIQEDFQDDIPF